MNNGMYLAPLRTSATDGPRFADIKFNFDCILQPTMADQIRFEREKQKEEARKKRVASRMALEEKEKEKDNEKEKEKGQGQDALFCEPNPAGSAAEGQNPLQEDEPHKPSEQPESKKPEKPKARLQNRITAAERRRSKNLGLDVVLGKEKQKGRGRGKKRETNDAKGGPSKKQQKEEAANPNLKLNDMVFSDVVEEAHVSSNMQACPGFTKMDKNKALTELIASIPAEDQNDAKSDKKKILEATRKFTRSARSDGNGGWKIKGLKTSLYHYQVRHALRNGLFDTG